MTNYEIVMRDMTPEKLAELIECSAAVNICSFCIFQRDYACHWNCHNGIEQWLKQEAKEDAAD